jgi:DNA-binding IscR family transcriptional regulator
MFLPKRVNDCILVFDVLARADCEWVPVDVISRVHDIPMGALKHVTFHLMRNGIIKGRRGPFGGIKMVRRCTLLELYQIFAPSGIPDPQQSSDRRTSVFLRYTRESMNRLWFEPHKIALLDFLLDSPDVEVVHSGSSD